MLSAKHLNRWWFGGATLVALAAVMVAYQLMRALVGDLLVNGPRGVVAVPLGAVVLATLAGGVAAWVLATTAGRTRRPRFWFAFSVVVGLLVSSVPPLTGAATTSIGACLLLLHAVVAVPLVAGGWAALTRPDPRRTVTMAKPSEASP